MNEREMMYRTRDYLRRLARGQDPFSGEELPCEELLNNVVLCRAFTQAADIMDQVISNNGVVKKLPNKRREPFRITDAERAAVAVYEDPVGIQTVSGSVSNVIGPNVRTIPAAAMTAWLEHIGLLDTAKDEHGNVIRVATTDGNAAGIQTVERTSRDGRVYRKNLYDVCAQSFIIENLEHIASYNGY